MFAKLRLQKQSTAQSEWQERHWEGPGVDTKYNPELQDKQFKFPALEHVKQFESQGKHALGEIP